MYLRYTHTVWGLLTIQEYAITQILTEQVPLYVLYVCKKTTPTGKFVEGSQLHVLQQKLGTISMEKELCLHFKTLAQPVAPSTL